jgi:hypothetical protein
VADLGSDILTCPQRLLSDSLPDRQRCAAF